MIDVFLARSLFEAISVGTRVVIVGDPNQLPSVGCGNVLLDIIKSQLFPVLTLREIQRQKQGSKIITGAHLVNEGRPPIMEPYSKEKTYSSGDVVLIQQEDSGDVDSYYQTAKIVHNVREIVLPIVKSLGKDPVKELQILSPMNKGFSGTVELNKALASLMNPSRNPNHLFAPGDRVMQTKNNYDLYVFNGDVGFVVSVEYKQKTKTASLDFERLAKNISALTVRFSDDKVVTYTQRAHILEVLPAWAISIHKSQGSEYPVTVIPLFRHSFIMQTRRLFYTALTRARDVVFLMGQQSSFVYAAKNNREAARNSSLFERLIDTPVQRLSSIPLVTSPPAQNLGLSTSTGESYAFSASHQGLSSSSTARTVKRYEDRYVYTKIDDIAHFFTKREETSSTTSTGSIEFSEAKEPLRLADVISNLKSIDMNS